MFPARFALRRRVSTLKRSEKREEKKKSRPDFVGIRLDFVEIIAHDSLESLLRAFWGKKKIKSAYIEKIKTLRGYIVKIETSVVELKITLNFRRVIRTFPKKKKNLNGLAMGHQMFSSLKNKGESTDYPPEV
jgi:hypothetical protein